MGTGVKELDKYNIDILKLSNDTHDYQFEIGNPFFSAFPDSYLKVGKGEVEVELKKNERLIELTFDINVSVELQCDRSLELYDYAINTTNKLILKFGEEEEEIDEQITIIPRGKQRINLAQWIYEYIGLSVPMKKLHPKFVDETDEDELVYTSDSDSDSDSNDDDGDIDPRWKDLEKLK